MQIRKASLHFAISAIVLLCTATGFMCKTKKAVNEFDKNQLQNFFNLFNFETTAKFLGINMFSPTALEVNS